ncbi:MAG: helix-turn-helix transcriptional regulator [Lachnospiraceae bacterium]|nr:helix-turn-helix transcriptional regulator [Lachnospiraceae bacterium]
MPNDSYESLQEIVEHENSDYPVGVYYVEPTEMFMEHVRFHWHTEIEIDLIKEGSAEYRFGEQSFVLHEGQAIYINGNVAHSISAVDDSPCVIMSLIFSPSFLFPRTNSNVANTYLRPISEDTSFKFRIFSNKDRMDKAIISYVEDILYTNLSKEFGYELKTQSLLCQLWLLLLSDRVSPAGRPLPEKENTGSSMTADETRIKDAILFIEQQYAEQITLADIADSIHVSKSECCRCFNRAVNMTPFEYLMHYRILKAADMIQKNIKDPIPVSELAANVGFNNASYFNKRFREYFGCTPTQYRKMAKTDHRDKLGTFGLSLSHI